MKPQHIHDLATRSIAVRGANKCEFVGRPRDHRGIQSISTGARTKWILPRVLLSTFTGSDLVGGATISVINHTSVASEGAGTNATLFDTSLAGNTTTNYGHANATVESNGLPPAPSFTATAVAPTQIDLAWNWEADANGYHVAEWTSSGWTLIGVEGSGTTTVTVNNLSPNTTYYFDVGAFSNAGYKLGCWYAHSATTLPVQGPPIAPSFTAAAVSSTQIDLTWNQVDPPNGYYVAEWTSSGWTLIGVEGSGTTTVTVNNLSPNTTYYFDVGAFNNAGTNWGAYAHHATTFPDKYPLIAPSFTATSVSSTQIDLAWNQVDVANGYYVAEWTSSGWTLIGVEEGSGTTSFAVNKSEPRYHLLF